MGCSHQHYGLKSHWRWFLKKIKIPYFKKIKIIKNTRNKTQRKQDILEVIQRKIFKTLGLNLS